MLCGGKLAQHISIQTMSLQYRAHFCQRGTRLLTHALHTKRRTPSKSSQYNLPILLCKSLYTSWYLAILWITPSKRPDATATFRKHDLHAAASCRSFTKSTTSHYRTSPFSKPKYGTHIMLSTIRRRKEKRQKPALCCRQKHRAAEISQLKNALRNKSHYPRSPLAYMISYTMHSGFSRKIGVCSCASLVLRRPANRSRSGFEMATEYYSTASILSMAWS